MCCLLREIASRARRSLRALACRQLRRLADGWNSEPYRRVLWTNPTGQRDRFLNRERNRPNRIAPISGLAQADHGAATGMAAAPIGAAALGAAAAAGMATEAGMAIAAGVGPAGAGANGGAPASTSMFWRLWAPLLVSGLRLLSLPLSLRLGLLGSKT